MVTLPESLLQVMKSYNLSNDDISFISERINHKIVKKGKVFSEAGRVCNKLGLLDSGLLFSSFHSDDGELNISRFFYQPKNLIVTSFDSFKNQSISDETITAIEDSSIYYLTFDGLNEVSISIPTVHQIIREFAEQSYILALRRIHDLQVLNNEQRIKKFYTNERELIKKVKKVHIASYLRVNRNDLTKVIKNS